MIGAVFPRRNHDISPNLALPAMSRIRIGQTLISCSTGFDRATMIRAAGEALERQLAFADRAGSAEQPMAIDQFDPDVLEWINLHSADQPDPPTELLASVVKELGTGRTRRFPSVAFALGPHIDTEHWDSFFRLACSSTCGGKNVPLLGPVHDYETAAKRSPEPESSVDAIPDLR